MGVYIFKGLIFEFHCSLNCNFHYSGFLLDNMDIVHFWKLYMIWGFTVVQGSEKRLLGWACNFVRNTWFNFWEPWITSDKLASLNVSNALGRIRFCPSTALWICNVKRKEASIFFSADLIKALNVWLKAWKPNCGFMLNWPVKTELPSSYYTISLLTFSHN